MEIRLIQPEETERALALVTRVFAQFEAPDYSQKGIETFRAFLADPESIAALTIYGAFSGGELLGVIATRGVSHIALFFVEAAHQGKGVGRALFAAVKAACPECEMTVNSSPYAVEIYRRLGFHPLSGEQTTDGIRFTPMKYTLKPEDSI